MRGQKGLSYLDNNIIGITSYMILSKYILTSNNVMHCEHKPFIYCNTEIIIILNATNYCKNVQMFSDDPILTSKPDMSYNSAFAGNYL